MIPMLNLSTVQAIRTVFGNLTMLGFLAETPRYINWYLSLILVTLVIAPIVHSILSNARKPLFAWALLVIAAGMIGLCYVAHNQLILYSRLPIFVLGMGFAMPVKGKERPKTAFVFYVLGFAAGAAMLWLCLNRYHELLLDYGMYWYPGLLMIPPICAVLGWLFRKASKSSFLLAPLRLLGQASFEIFLYNTWFELYCKEIACYTEPKDYLLWMLFSIAAGVLTHLGMGFITKAISRKSATP
jgi:surface polysaccharide O-acyltransferase-like enzyme